MFVMLTLCLLQPPAIPGIPGLADLERFPGHREARAQLGRCREWLEYLDYLARHVGETAQIQQWRTQTRWIETYWHILVQASDCHLVDEWRLTALEKLEEHIGIPAYRAGWTPPLFPEDMPRVPRPSPRTAGNQ